MQSEFVQELMRSMNAQLLSLIVQLVVSGLVLMSIKDFSFKVLNFMKLKYSDFGRGTEIEIVGKNGYIMHVGFNEVEIYLDEDQTLFMPVENFIKANKIIIRKVRKTNESSR